MSFLRSVNQRMEILEMNDVSDLCVLGFLFDDARNLASLNKAIRAMDVQTWQPTTEVIESSLQRLLDKASVVKLEAGNETYLSITGLGIKHFFNLMRRPMPNNAHICETVLALKSSFVELLPDAVCGKVVEELIGFYNCQLSCLENRCEDCPLKSQRRQIHNERQLYQIRQELNWLGGLTQMLSSRSA